MHERPNPEPELSAIVVTHDRADLVERCLASLCAEREGSVEVVVVLNGARPEVAGVVRRFEEQDPRVRSMSILGATASEARNRAVEIAHGALLYFLDDDVEVPPGGLRAAVELFQARPGVMIAGGPNLTPPDDSEFSQMAGALLASRFGTGITHYRYARGSERSARERHLTLCNLVVVRKLFEAGIRFPRQFGGEENVLMGRAGALGHPFWYSPALWVYHHRREDLGTHLHQMRRYGFGRGIAVMTAPGTLHVAYLAPLGLLAYGIVAVPASLFGQPLLLSPFALYGVLAVVASAAIAIRARRPSWAARLPGLFAATHFVYAVGLVEGVLRVWRRGGGRRKGERESTRPRPTET